MLAALIWSQRERGPLVVSGLIEADDARVGSRVGGRVATVSVDDGEAVKAGEELVRLDPFTLQAERAQAAATLAERQAELTELENGSRPEEIASAEAAAQNAQARYEEALAGPRVEAIRAAEAERDLAQAQVNLSKVTFARSESLFTSRAVSAQELDRARQEYQVAVATLRARQENLTELLCGTRPEQIEQARAQAEQAKQNAELVRKGPRVERVDQARAAVRAARANLEAIDKRLEELVIRAPVDGLIETVDLYEGDMLAPNQPALTMIDPDRLWIRAYVPENALDLRVGWIVPVTVDSYPGETFRGRVSFVSRQGEFTPRNLQTTEKRVNLVFEIRVDLIEGVDRLRAGMFADVTLRPETGSEKGSPPVKHAPGREGFELGASQAAPEQPAEQPPETAAAQPAAEVAP